MLTWEFHSDETGDFAPNQPAAVGGLLVCRDHFGEDLVDALYDEIVGALPWVEWPLHARTLGRTADVLLWLTLWPGAAGEHVQAPVARLCDALARDRDVAAAWRRLTERSVRGDEREADLRRVDAWLRAAPLKADVDHVRGRGDVAIRTARTVVEQCLQQAIALGDVEIIVAASANSVKVSPFDTLYWVAVERAVDVLLQKPGEHRLVLLPQRRDVDSAIGVPQPMNMRWLAQGVAQLAGNAQITRGDASVVVEPARPTVFRGPDVSALAVCADVLCHALFGRLSTKPSTELDDVARGLARRLAVPLVSPSIGLPTLASDGAPREAVRNARAWARPSHGIASPLSAQWATQQAQAWCIP